MAFNDDQREFPLSPPDDRRRSSQHLPRYFRTQTNNKFLSSTFDQLIQPGVTEKINGYLGRETAPGYSPSDFYIGDVSKQREDYQLEPAAVVKDDLDNVQFYGDYNDYINQIRSLDGNVEDHSLLNRQEYYSWNPHIDWDKFVNFREYYWLPNGPQSIPVSGDAVAIQSTYTVTNEDNLDNYAFVLTPDGLTQNPELTLYRGVTYRFEIDSPGVPLSFRSNRLTAPQWRTGTFYSEGETVLYERQIYTANGAHRSGNQFEDNQDLWDINTELNLLNEVSQQGVENGVIELTLFSNTPDFIYYVSDSDVNAGSLIRVYDKEEASFIDVEQEIIGKKTYTAGEGFELSNGMKIRFQGTTSPEKYQQGSWYVEGVGTAIKLIAEDDLNVASDFVQDEQINFDSEGFDTAPYSRAIGFPREKDYFTSNRSSRDGNLWSRYNRWFHRDIIDLAADLNGTERDLDQSARAVRPIIEFEAGLKLFDFGTESKQAVDLVDDFTTDVFSTVEGAEGYNIDGIDIVNGMRILFTADTDIRVVGKIYQVRFILFRGRRQIALVETEDSNPIQNQTVICKQGNFYKGIVLYFTGDNWKLAQQKTSVNQEPLFDVFDCDGFSLADREVYQSSDFTGTKLFSYKRGQGFRDTELGFPLTYRSIQNTGDIVFDFNLSSDAMTFCPSDSEVVNSTTGSGYLRQYSSIEDFAYVNGYKKADLLSYQPVIRQYEYEFGPPIFPIDVYDSSGLLNDLNIKVFVNGERKDPESDYQSGFDPLDRVTIIIPEVRQGDIVQIKTRSSQPKNQNGFYEIASNLERNPLNADVSQLTLGEINDHVRTIIEEVEEFDGSYPGTSNLRDQGDVSKFGRRIIKHSSPLNLALYHLLDHEANLVKALKFARQEYAKFKRNFAQIAADLKFQGAIDEHFELVMRGIIEEKPNSDPFYFSDMLATGGKKTARFTVTSPDQQFFALSNSFNLEQLSDKAVYVYLNGIQLINGKDYTFNNEGFVVVNAEIERGDEIVINEFENTNGSFIPATPTKLGLYPKYAPSKFIDDRYITPREVIQGHDGSIITAFGDFRDDLFLELEKRIYNNIKIKYDSDLFDIEDYLPSQARTTGLTRSQIDQTMISDFIQWTSLVNDDYTENNSYDSSNSFTWNYNAATNYAKQPVQGSWRQIYTNAYDTDRPHTNPWEMLGFTAKPDWWQEQYGKAPYTSNNLLMWEDIENGIIREPGKNFKQFSKYTRPDLVKHLPVDEHGTLLSPLDSNYIRDYNILEAENNWVYGDWSPVETAWRKSSEYPFALLTSLFLNQPCRTMSVAFDRSRQKKGLVDDIIYQNPNNQIRLKDIVFPNSIRESERVFTSGFVNYIRDYISSSVDAVYEEYKTNIRNINNQIGAKLAGFTTKDKFRLILDSRTPLNEGNVFVPDENYQIFLNTSTPTRTVYYSGVIIEKQTDGFLVRGYNTEQPLFYYTEPNIRNRDPIINIGGIEEIPIEWTPARTLTRGTIVIFQSQIYRVTISHVTTERFEEEKFTKIPKPPVEGGIDASIRKSFKEETAVISYGTVLKNAQDVVDFLLGYGNWLESQGFLFDYYDIETGIVADWETAAKEYLFWTTQNWSNGSVISLSPGAFKLKILSEQEVVDDIYDTLYGYSLLKVDGEKFQPEYVSLTREEPREFEIRPKNTEDGVFGVRIGFVQKEHVVLLDNTTQFGDIIYDQPAGYRQERIRVLGYRTANWDGSANIPGFIFDEVRIQDWERWKDYAAGDIVRYKEFFYAATNKIAGSAVFNDSEWSRLSERPVSKLLPNFEYKTNQFADFYDLDTDNFDPEQQKFAQHLIGYQNREYLANIINDDVSQYKFYQGFIQDKGTANAFTKLFDALGSANKDSLEFYEEWAIKSGQYGAADGFEEVEYLLDESEFRISPQPIRLIKQPVAGVDLVYNILPRETYLKPRNYDHAPFPQKPVIDTFVKNSGYVNLSDIDFRVDRYNSILNLAISEVEFGSKIWVGNDNNTWNIYTAVRTNLSIISASMQEAGYDLEMSSTDWDIQIGDIIGIFNISPINGIYKVLDISNNTFSVEFEDPESLEFTGQLQGQVIQFISSRFSDVSEAVTRTKDIDQGIDRLWIDETDNAWRVIDRNASFTEVATLSAEALDTDNFGSSIDSNKRNTVLAVGDPDNSKVHVYTRSVESANLIRSQTLEITDNISEPNAKFGADIAVSDTGKYIAVGSPNASKVQTFFRGNFEEDRNYIENSIVEFQDSFWQAAIDIQGATGSIQFGSFESVPQILVDLNLGQQDSEFIPVLFAGNYPFENQTADHFIVKAPLDMYEGSDVGDTVNLKWNTLSYAYQDTEGLESIEPFEGNIDEIDSDFITQGHVISEKIDSILFVNSSTNIPNVGQIVETQSAFGTVAYTYNESAQVTIYIKDQNGDFGLAGSLITSIGEFVGEYETQAPTEQTLESEEYWGGFWKIDVNQYQIGSVIDDSGRGLVYTDIIPQGESDTNRIYFNILDFESDAFSSFDTRYSEISTLTFEGLPGPEGVSGVFPSSLYVLRAPKALTDELESGDDIEVFYNTLQEFETGDFKDPATIGLSASEINRKHQIEDLWDGYIDFEITKNLGGVPIEPKVGITVRDVTNGGTGLVTFYQRFDSTSGRVFVKDIQGEWALGNIFGENREIEFLADGSGDAIYDPAIGSRVFGQIQSRSLGYEPGGIGKLVVLETRGAAEIELQDESRILEAEYWFYLEGTVDGIQRESNVPAESNNDWIQVFNIPAGVGGDSSNLDNEGLFSIYERTGTTQWTKINDFIVPQRDNNNKLGSQLEFAEINGLVKLFVKTAGNNTTNNSGKIYVIKNGEENGYFYSWDLGRDKEYKGQFSEARNYFDNDIVFLDGELYQAQTNIVSGEFNSADWLLLDNRRDYLGFIPNDSGDIFEDDSTISNIEDLQEFARDFDVSENGEVLITSSFYNDSEPNRVVIYRNLNGAYIKSQEILAPTTTDDYGNSISISADGTYIAVGAPLDDRNGINQGAVYVYRQSQREFRLVQELVSSRIDENEQFGHRVAFDGTSLAVTSRNGDSFTEITFDNGTTIFDRQFTKFRDFEEDTGVVQLFELFDRSFLYAQTVDFDDSRVRYFGKTLYINNNHLYSRMLISDSGSAGTISEYRKPQGQKLWQERRAIKPTVDVSKIKKVSLYNTRENQLIQYLDYIDPLQGKVAGIAEQEISFKLYHDPAVYTEGSGVQVDSTNSWGKAQVGKIWWDLSNAKFLNPYQGEVVFSANNWNTLFSDANSIDVYEWVETDLLPSEWDQLANTEQGFNRGISGTSRYSDSAYVTKRTYDKASQTFSRRYYYWVQNKLTVPNQENRNLSAQDIADLIRDPQSEGYRFVSLISPTEFALYNCEGLITDKDVAISIQYYTIDDQSINIHNQYEIISEGLASSRPNRDVEQKWFDSLVGFDVTRRPVPAPELSEKEKYGILNTPRQGWFINRAEALKQVIERINSILIGTLIVDEKDISRLTEQEKQPSAASNLFDTRVESDLDLEFIGVARARQAQLSAVIENGKLIRVEILDSGRGYLAPPTVEVLGTGVGAEITVQIDSQGRVVEATVESQGEFYQTNTGISVRRFTALVENDSTLDGRWALYERNTESGEWVRAASQGFDVSQYWEYRDWYMQGYNQFTNIDYVIDASYELQSLDDRIGDIVKIENIGSGGWLLLEKIDNRNTTNYTVNYRTIGRQDATLQFKDTLYNVESSLVGFDVTSYDDLNFDSLPSIETRIILETVRDSIFTGDLTVEYNRLFFASLRYVFTEQNYVDWAFKTSFIKAQHNVGELEQKVSFQNDSLPSYESYVNEVKPYSANIREYLSSYERLEDSNTMVTDFDLAPRFIDVDNTIQSVTAKVENNAIVVRGAPVETYPDLHWLDNTGYSVTAVNVSNGGRGYTSAPVVNLVGGGGTGAKAVSSIGPNGEITEITVTSPGQDYLSAPTVEINGSLAENSETAVAAAVIGNSPVRSMNTVIKFDRVSGEFEFVNLRTVEQFVGSGSRLEFNLEWPMDLRTTRVRVFVDGSEALGGLYTYSNMLDTSKGYDRFQGRIVFTTAPAEGKPIQIEYFKAIDFLNAQDRINTAYEPGQGNLGKSLGQLMEGVDYGGVEVTSFGFASTSGWDSQPWTTNTWDIFDTEFEDEIILRKQVTLNFSSKIIETYTLDDSVAYQLQVSDELVQDSTHGIGKIKSIGDTFIVLDCDLSAQFNTVDQIRVSLEDSSESPVVIEDSSIAVPASVEEIVLLKNPLSSENDYNIYIQELDENRNLIRDLRLDDPDFGTSDQTNLDAVTETISGDGSTQEIVLSDLNIPTQVVSSSNELILIIRKTTSDGSFIPDPESYDTAISGGNLAYSTAQGIKAEEINIDGDGFVTPTTSKGPEEIVPGQVLDTLDITVYESVGAGASNIVARNYIADGETLVFDIGTTPVKEENLFVKIDNEIQDNTDYQIDYVNNTITFGTTPAENQRINLINLGNSASRILDIEKFVADGETGQFLTNVRWGDNIEAFVTVNGKTVEYVLFESDNSYDIAGNVIVELPTVPAENAAINIVLLTDGVEFRNYSVVETDEFIADGSTVDFVLDNNIFAEQPALSYTIVKVNDTILSAGYNEKFAVTASREYQLDLTQIPLGSVNANELEVYLNDRKLTLQTEWSFIGSDVFDTDNNSQEGSIIKLEPGIGGAGDILRVYIIADAEYRFGFFDSENQFVPTRGEDSTFPVLYLNQPYTAGDKITVYTFSNHDSQKIERQRLEVSENVETTPGTDAYYAFRRLERGIISLRTNAQSTEEVWVVQNGELLSPSVNYWVSEDGSTVNLVNSPQQGDVIEVIHFSNSAITNRFGWRQFKDMLNRTHYKKLGKVFRLGNDLKFDDTVIEVEDASELPQPDYNTKTPGVIFLDKERIEYFIKDGNQLKQLRRGTLGTGVKQSYSAGTVFMEQGRSNNLPYRDQTDTVSFVGDAITFSFKPGFDITSQDEIEVFVAGKRLHNNSIEAFDNTVAQDSPEGDVVQPPEYSVVNGEVKLENTPDNDVDITVTRKIGTRWNDEGTPLARSNTDVARFLQSSTTDLPR